MPLAMLVVRVLLLSSSPEDAHGTSSEIVVGEGFGKLENDPAHELLVQILSLPCDHRGCAFAPVSSNSFRRAHELKSPLPPLDDFDSLGRVLAIQDDEVFGSRQTEHLVQRHELGVGVLDVELSQPGSLLPFILPMHDVPVSIDETAKSGGGFGLFTHDRSILGLGARRIITSSFS